MDTKTDPPAPRDLKAKNARSTVGQVAALIRDDPEALLAYREAMLGKEGGDKRSSVTTTDDNVIGERSPVGNSRAYSLARVQRECDADTPKENPLCAH